MLNVQKFSFLSCQLEGGDFSYIRFKNLQGHFTFAVHMVSINRTSKVYSNLTTPRKNQKNVGLQRKLCQYFLKQLQLQLQLFCHLCETLIYKFLVQMAVLVSPKRFWKTACSFGGFFIKNLHLHLIFAIVSLSSRSNRARRYL